MERASGTLVGGRYRLEHELARGGMGSVWVATHRQLDTRIAVKFMDPALASDAEARGRFEREAKAAAALRSPHVVQILDYGIEQDTPYIAMELLAGEDLRSRMKRTGRLSLGEASTVLGQACKALRLAAEAGIVHRDLKPGNIFLARSGDDELVKILDFGVAKAPKQAVGVGTSSGMLLGSPHYMSPEQARGGRKVDHRSDLWSLAVILYQMISGVRPFQGDELGDVIVNICTEPAPPLREADPTLPAALEPFFVRALCRDPDGRFQSARSLAVEFGTIAADHEGLPSPSASLSGAYEAPAMGSGSFPSVGGAPSDGASSSSADAPRPGTLTLATQSVGRPMRRGPRWAVLAGGGAVLSLLALLAWLAASPDGETVAGPLAAPGAPLQDNTVEPPLPAAAPEPSTTAFATAASSEPSATASAAPTVSAAPPPRRPVRPTPPKTPRPTPTSRDPILGF